MRHTSLAVLLVFTACATAEKKPAEAAAPAAPAAAEPAKPAAEAAPAGALATLEFASATATKTGAELMETRYSERPDDAAITDKKFENGAVTWTGQVGFGKGSSWAGIGFFAFFHADKSPVDLSAAKAVKIRLASPTTRTLRVRVAGADEKIRNMGCYPVSMQQVTAEAKEYTIPISQFSPEGWCAANGRSIQQTLPQAVGFEIVDLAIQKSPTSFSVGTITVQ
ncbi:MAG TPA: hypothetical protein VEB43_07145 [Anaeromyxobacter sp.]|nr:hypothetical protein [Anaeromyxobacter sp.]